MAIVLTNERKAVLEEALPVLAAFKQTFGRDVTPGFLAELFAAREYNLTLLDGVNAPGADATDSQGRRYQIKYRSPTVLNVDINNFDFDWVVLVNVTDDYQLAGIWRLSVDQVRAICASRDKFRKFQVAQTRFKSEALRYEQLLDMSNEGDQRAPS